MYYSYHFSCGQNHGRYREQPNLELAHQENPQRHRPDLDQGLHRQQQRKGRGCPQARRIEAFGSDQGFHHESHVGIDTLYIYSGQKSKMMD